MTRYFYMRVPMPTNGDDALNILNSLGHSGWKQDFSDNDYWYFVSAREISADELHREAEQHHRDEVKKYKPLPAKRIKKEYDS